jgi:DNA-binding NarL/FixJ family response regulator
MTEIDTIKAAVLLLSNRVTDLESQISVPCLRARVVAREIGLDPESVCDLNDATSRSTLSVELHRRGWSYSQIARALRVCEKSVSRYMEGVSRH